MAMDDDGSRCSYRLTWIRNIGQVAQVTKKDSYESFSVSAFSFSCTTSKFTVLNNPGCNGLGY